MQDADANASGPTVLFAAFEPSGDSHAAPVIRTLRDRIPGVGVVGLGGPKMEAAGATMLEHTTGRAVMAGEILSQMFHHRKRLRMLREWLQNNRIDAFVPVDSPTANWDLCKLVRKYQPNSKIVHLVLPQVWAWASWRVRWLRKLSDHVMCILPFEPAWLAARGVEGTFVGHPVYNRAAAINADQLDLADAPDAPLRLALLPGSRTAEIERNGPTMFAILQDLRRRHPQLAAVVAAASEPLADTLRDMAVSILGRRHVDQAVQIRTGEVDAVLNWSSLVLVVSGTATLQVTAHRRPMVVFYNASRFLWLTIGWWMLKAPACSLPNIVACMEGGDRIVPEFIPHFGHTPPIIEAVDRLIRDEPTRRRQLEALDALSQRFAGHDFAAEATDTLIARAGLA